MSQKEAERRAWATDNEDDSDSKKAGGSGRGKHTGHPAAHKGGEKGGKAAASQFATDCSASAKKAADAQAQRRASRSRLETAMQSKLLSEDDGVRTFVVVLDSNDEAFRAISDFTAQQNVTAAGVTAIGALGSATVEWFGIASDLPGFHAV